MPTNERVTVTLPADLVRDIDRLEKNRSKFIQEAARRELERRRRERPSLPSGTARRTHLRAPSRERAA